MTERPWIIWKRWWRPLGASVRTDGRGGFLTDPDSEYGRFAAENVSPISELLDGQCLILCGEPGMGKTTELNALEQRLIKEGHGVIRVSFRSCLDATDFEKRIFGATRWKKWMRSQGHLYLLIDGVDEGLWLIPNFLEWFIDKLRDGIPLDRLSVILACRTLEWPQDLGRELAGLWIEPLTDEGERRGSVFELCTLTRDAAIAASEAYDVPPNDFLRAVFERQVEALAARPLTLFMLLDEFRDKGRELGRTRRELYLEFCRRLCRDHDPERANRLRRREVKWLDYRPTQLQTVAGRIAAMMLLGAKNAVLLQDGGPQTSTDLPVTDVEAGVETDATGEFPVTEDLLLATRATGLFSGKGPGRFGFEHQTFAECLAGQYLAAINLGPLRTILFRHDNAGEYVVPQLAELAAWLAGERDDVFDLLLQKQPEILLRSDLAHVPDNRKRAVVQALLKKRRTLSISNTPSAALFTGTLIMPDSQNNCGRRC